MVPTLTLYDLYGGEGSTINPVPEPSPVEKSNGNIEQPRGGASTITLLGMLAILAAVYVLYEMAGGA